LFFVGGGGGGGGRPLHIILQYKKQIKNE